MILLLVALAAACLVALCVLLRRHSAQVNAALDMYLLGMDAGRDAERRTYGNHGAE